MALTDDLQASQSGDAPWDLSQITLSGPQQIIAEELRLWLGSQNTPLAQSIANLSPGKFSDDEMRLLEQVVITHFRPLQRAAEVLIVLCKVVDWINLKASPRLPNPRIPNLRIRPSNPFRKGVADSLHRVRSWRTTLMNSNQPRGAKNADAEGPEAPDPRRDLGKLLASAILHGALADSSLLVALAQALSVMPQSFLVINGRLGIELSIAWQGEAGSEHRYWYPDALTATLIARLPDGAARSLLTEKEGIPLLDKQVRERIWQCVLAYFRSARVKKPERPRSLKHMLVCVGVDLHTKLPSVLAGYASRKLISHSPGKHVLSRIFNLAIPPQPKQDDLEHAPPADLITRFNQNSDDYADLEPHWLSGLRKTFSLGKASDIERRLDEIAMHVAPSSVDECFTLFAHHLVSSLSASGNKLALSTARAYLVSVAKRLGGRLGNVDPRTLASETLETLYGEILEDEVSEKGARNQRRHIARALREFHHFLVHKFQFESINAREVLGIGKGLVPVDANFITPDEYSKIFLAIPEIIKVRHPTIPAQAKLAKAAQLVFMLSFHCGLRRMEVLKLKTIDFSEHVPEELLIRPSDARRLKTKSSTRKIPLYTLLTEQERLDLWYWKRARLAESTGQSAVDSKQFLFGIPELAFDFIPEDTLFPIIHDAMRSVTRDQSLRFHHLRHSFATWTFLKLMIADLKEEPRLFPRLPTTSYSLFSAWEFRYKLYNRSDPTRRHVYAVASLLGHSGPDISLEHYIHCCDILLALWMDQDIAAPPGKSTIAESNRPQSTAYRWQSLGHQNIPYRLIKKRWPELVPVPSRVTAAALSPSAPSPSNSTIKPADDPRILGKIYDLLFQHGMHGTPVGDLAASLGLPVESAHLMVATASKIRDMKAGRGGKGYRHRFIEVVLDRRKKDEQTRIACPVAPHTARDRAIAESLEPSLLNVIKTSPELCEKVFDYYLSNAWQTRNDLIFQDPDHPGDALQFVTFLEALGFKRSALHFISYDTGTRSRALGKWKTELGLTTRHHIEKKVPPRKTNLSSRGWLGIKPVFSVEYGQNKTPGADQEGSIAFRYLMVLGAIFFANRKALSG